ncbi:MAG: hypothetical protein H7840_06220 [Alphaproteobacteria bacterium]
MARKKPTNTAYVYFDIVYEDGTRSSNRKIASAELQGLDGDAPAKAMMEAQDLKIAAMSGNPRGPIRTITRSPGQ